MAPDPRGQDDATVGSSIISGHKISLSVHYDGTQSLEKSSPNSASTALQRGEDVVDKSASPVAIEAISKPIDATEEKITHIDHVVMKVAETEESLETSIPSSSSLLSEVRPITPETTSAHSDTATQETPIPSTTPASNNTTVADIDDTNMSKSQEYLNGPDQIIPTNCIKSWEPSGTVKIRLGQKGASSYTPKSIPTFLKNAAEKMGDGNALAFKKDNEWQYITYKQYYDQVKTVSKAFIKLGLERFHGVCILGFNSVEWFLSDLGAVFAGGFAAGLYTTNSAEACEHCAINCKAQIFVVEDQKQLDKVLKIKGNLPHLKTIIQYSGKPTVEGVLSWDEVMNIGKKESEAQLQDRLKRIAINQCCTLIYTSGTTGAPKGVMLTHDNLTWVATTMTIDNNLVQGKETIISFLPLSHVAAQVADIFLPMGAMGTVYFAQPDALKGSLGATLKEVRPTQFLGVPRVWEKIYEKMQEVGRKTTGVKKNIATWAKSIGLETNTRRSNGDNTKPFGYSIANALVFKKIKAVLGLDRAHLCLSGAAPIAPEVVRYFHSLDICLTELYGMSESTGPQTLCTPSAFKFGSCGQTIGGCYTKLEKPDHEGNGEVCMGGRNICMGYLQMEEKTHEAIDDEGWLHSGDIGKFDEDGFLFITGRLKELIITAGGENIPPVLIEDNLKGELQCISNAMLIGDKRKFLSILLTLKTEMDLETGEALDELSATSKEWCRSVGSPANTIQDVLSGPDAKIMRAIQDGIDRTNKKATSNAQKIQKWTIIPRDFTIPTGELGPTMKLKRPVVAKKYSETIERFYQ